MKCWIAAAMTALVLAWVGCRRGEELPLEPAPQGRAPEAPSQPISPAREASGQVTVSFVVAQFPVQMALWVEDAQGRYVRTLYVSQWEAAAGHARNILPQWVEASREARGTDRAANVDAVTSATLKAGEAPVAFTWDLKDWKGETVLPGDYLARLQCDGKRGVITWTGRVAVTAQRAEVLAVPEPAPAADGSNAYVRDMKVAFVPP